MTSERNKHKPRPRADIGFDTTLGEAALKAIRVGLDAMTLYRDRVPHAALEDVHQFRVASRRLRATFEVFDSAIYAAALRFTRREIGWIADEAGAVRNCDVLKDLFAARGAKLSARLAPGLVPIDTELSRERDEAHEKLARGLESRRYRTLVARIYSPAIKRARAQVRLGPAAAEMIEPLVERAAVAAARIGPGAPHSAFHKLRVRVKRLRYSLEVLSPLGQKRIPKALARLEALQTTLGEMNDIAVAIDWLQAYAARDGAPVEAILAAGALIEWLETRISRLRNEAIEDWARLERSGALVATIAELRANARKIIEAERLAARIKSASTGAVATREPEAARVLASSTNENRAQPAAVANNLIQSAANDGSDHAA